MKARDQLNQMLLRSKPKPVSSEKGETPICPYMLTIMWYPEAGNNFTFAQLKSLLVMPSEYKALTLSQEVGLHFTQQPHRDLKEGEALVRIRAAALNHRDEFIREGLYPNIQFPAILGSDGCGIVEDIRDQHNRTLLSKEVIINPGMNWGDTEAAQSKHFQILGMPSPGVFAEYAIVPVENLYRKPPHLGAAQAAALPLAGLTGYRALITKGELKPAQKVLVTGIGGGVAQMVLLMASARNADIHVTSGEDAKLDRAKELGALDGVNYRQSDWPDKLKKQSGGFDLIIDSAGGDQWNALIDLLKPGGQLVFYGATLGAPSSLNLHKIFWKQLTLQGTTMGSDQDFEDMLSFVEKNRLVPTVDSIRPFDQVIEAFDQIKAGTQFGKLVVKME